MTKMENVAKERILNAAVDLFSEKGFDAASVNEISARAGVNKALIYYYFKDKSDILDQLVLTIVEGIADLSQNFIFDTISEMVEVERVEILSDRLRFWDNAAVDYFRTKLNQYFSNILDYAIAERQLIKIIMLESLKESKYQNKLFRLLTPGTANDQILARDDELFSFHFYFLLVPIFNFAAYCDVHSMLANRDEGELQADFVHSLQLVISAIITDREILLKGGSSCS